jgi:MYXO-CTERM domain-containing protein
VLFASGSAAAFDDASQFFAQPSTPHAATYGASAEGLYFTGAPRFLSMTCAECHTDGPQQVRLKLGADDPSLFTDGYQPGNTYELEVELLDEVEGLDYTGTTCTEPPGRNDKYTYVQCNNNSFALEVDAPSGPLGGPGVFCPQAPLAGMCPRANPFSDEVVVAPDGDAVFGNRTHDPVMTKVVARNDPTTWHLWWTAPQSGTGPVTIYVAVVDGNGGSGTAESDQDPYGDDTVQASVFVRESGGQLPSGATAGCGVAPSSGAGSAWPLAALLLFVLLRLRSKSPSL